MRFNWRTRFTWFYAGFFTVLAVGGQSLHSLPGMGHHCCCCGDDDDDCCEAAADEDGGTDSALAEVVVPCGDVHDGVARISADHCSPLAVDEEHCLLCRFLGQGLWFGHAVGLPAWQFLLRFERPVKTIKVACRFEHLLFQSRAPPISAAC